MLYARAATDSSRSQVYAPRGRDMSRPLAIAGRDPAQCPDRRRAVLLVAVRPLLAWTERLAESRIVAQRIEVRVRLREPTEARVLRRLRQVLESGIVVSHQRLDAREVVEEARVSWMNLE